MSLNLYAHARSPTYPKKNKKKKRKKKEKKARKIETKIRYCHNKR